MWCQNHAKDAASSSRASWFEPEQTEPSSGDCSRWAAPGLPDGPRVSSLRLGFPSSNRLPALLCSVASVMSHTIQFCSVQSQSCPTFCDPMDCSTPGLPVHHQLPEFTQVHVGDAIQPSHPLSPSSPPALNLSQHQGLFQ